MEESLEITFSSKLIHRFSDEVKALRVSENESLRMSNLWPAKKSVEYYQKLVSSDLQRQKMKLGPRYNFLFPSEGSTTTSFGNDFGWYTFTCFYKFVSSKRFSYNLVSLLRIGFS